MTRRQALRLKNRYSRRLLARPEVAGVGVGRGNRRGSFHVVVFVTSEPTAELSQELTAVVEGNPFKLIKSGPFQLQPVSGRS